VIDLTRFEALQRLLAEPRPGARAVLAARARRRESWQRHLRHLAERHTLKLGSP
jgi:hypothetical protein